MYRWAKLRNVPKPLSAMSKFPLPLSLAVSFVPSVASISQRWSCEPEVDAGSATGRPEVFFKY